MNNKKFSLSSFAIIAISVFVAGLIGTQVVMALLGGTSPQTPVAQAAYDEALKTGTVLTNN